MVTKSADAKRSAANQTAVARRKAAHQYATQDALAQARALHPVVSVRSYQIVDAADAAEAKAAETLVSSALVTSALASSEVVAIPVATENSAANAVMALPGPPPAGPATPEAVAAPDADDDAPQPAVSGTAVVEDENAPGPPGPPGPPGVPAPGAAAGDDDDAPAGAPPGVPDADGIGTGSDIGAPATRTRASFVEVGLSSASLSDGFGSWSGIYLRSQLRLSEINTLSFEVDKSRQFGDNGTFVGLGLTHIFNDNWFGSVSGGTSTGGFFLPRARADVFINRKLLRAKNLVATLGAGFFKARDVYTDRSLYMGATYYFAPRWIVEGGIRFNNSNPGSVGSTSQFAALTYGEDKKRFITARVGNGRESYQLIGQNLGLVDFASNEQSLTVRQWFGESRGVNLSLERYSNPSYNRRGVSLGYFQDF